MKIYNPIGSKERFLEMYQGVNKMHLNEDIMQQDGNINVIENAFNGFKNGQLHVKQTNSKGSGNQNDVEIIGDDDKGNHVIMRFRLSGTEGDQDDVYTINSAEIVGFQLNAKSFNMDVPEGMNSLKTFNAKHGDEIADVIGKYVDFNEEPAIDEEFDEAIKLIDKVPYKKGTEDMQTNKAYADQKPTNTNVRLDNPELQKFVSEIDDYDPENDNVFSLPPDYDDTENIEAMDDSQEEPELDDEPIEDLTPEENELNFQAYDNLIAKNKTSRNPNYSPTMPEIMAEIDRLKKAKNPPSPKEIDPDNHMAAGKTRVYPKIAEPFLPENNTVSTNDAVMNYYNNSSSKTKDEVIKMAADIVNKNLGDSVLYISDSDYIKRVREMAVIMYANKLKTVNETDYPKQMEIGKEFKTTSNFPKQKKKYKAKKTIIKTGIDEDLNNLLYYSQSARDAGYLYPNAKEFGVTNQHILRDAFKDVNIELLDIQPSENQGTFWLYFSKDEKKYKALIKRSYGNAYKVVQSILAKLSKGIKPIEEKELMTENYDYQKKFGRAVEMINQIIQQAKVDDIYAIEPDSTWENNYIFDKVVLMNTKLRVYYKENGGTGWKDKVNDINLTQDRNNNFDEAKYMLSWIKRSINKGRTQERKNSQMQEGEKLENDNMSLEPKGDEVSQLAQDKEETGEILKGGKGDDKSPLEFDPDQITKGLKVEKEHTDDPMIAIEIVLDHLTEDPEYYTVKDNPEASAQVGAANDAENDDDEPESDDKEITDTLLGYKSKNVGDEVSEDIIGAAGAQPAVGSDITSQANKFKEYQKKDVNSLNDNEKSEYFELWKQFVNSENMNEEFGYEEYQGNIGDRYVDNEGNEFVVSAKVKGGVDLRGQGGETTRATSDLKHMKKINEINGESNSEYNGWSPTIPYSVLKTLKLFGHSSYRPTDDRTVVAYYMMPDGYVIADENNYAIDRFQPYLGGIINKDGNLFDRKNNNVTDIIRNSAKEYSNISDGLKNFIFLSSINNLNEQQIKLARQALNKRGLNEGMSKKEAIQILIKHNIK